MYATRAGNNLNISILHNLAYVMPRIAFTNVFKQLHLHNNVLVKCVSGYPANAKMPNDNVDKSTKTDPGASRHGNFMNYYQFHPAEERVRQLPPGVWRVDHPARKYAVLDIGCNAGVRAAAVRDDGAAETGWLARDPKLQTARLILVELSLFRYRSRGGHTRFRRVSFVPVRDFVHVPTRSYALSIKPTCFSNYMECPTTVAFPLGDRSKNPRRIPY